MKFNIEWSLNGPVHLKVLDDAGAVLQDIGSVLSTRDVCRLMKRSRRHLYRYIQQGWLTPVAKFSGEFFFHPKDIELLRGDKRTKRVALPPTMSPLFPEHDIRSLNVERDSDVILSRILERGNTKEIVWANRHYSHARRRQFVLDQGQRLLSRRTFRFWSWLWHVPVEQAKLSWRRGGTGYGGVE